MAESTGKPKLVLAAELLSRHSVDFIVIGGQAASLFGSPVPTFDVDLCYRRTQKNLEQLAAALNEINVSLRGAPPDLPFIIDARSLALGSNFTFNTTIGPLDLLGYVEPLGGYDELLTHSERIILGTIEVNVIGLNDLITVKRHICRPKDQFALLQLEAIKSLREQAKD